MAPLAPGGAPYVVQVPGKLILLGEYAVLRGAPALVVAVDRFATCTVTPAGRVAISGVGLGSFEPGDGGDSLPFARAVLAQGPPPAPGHYRIDTQAFGDADAPGGWTKLGLGSSAASTVALARAVDPQAAPAAIYRRAQAAHRAVQGTGSGADIAASAAGGAFAYQWWADGAQAPAGAWGAGDGAGQVTPLAHRQAVWAAWAGAPASTPALVGQVQAFGARQPAALAARYADLAAAAAAGIAAWGAGDRGALVQAARAGGAAMQALAADSGAPLVAAAHLTLARLAADVGGASKPTGAGGGDLAWLIGPDADAEARLAQTAQGAGFRVYRFEIAAEAAVGPAPP